MGPHPAVAEIRRAVRPYLKGRVLVACSGGPDSLALAAAVAFEAPRKGVAAGLITIDHGLQDGSDEHAQRVAALGYELGFDPVEICPISVGTMGGPEAAARWERYAALSATAAALDADVLLGHTLDDQAETVLMGLGRGSGARSIAGMRPRTGRYLRPMLKVRRATTVAACMALGLDFWSDPHNFNPNFQRSRLRFEVLPLMDEVLQGGVGPALARTAEQMRDDLDALDALAMTHRNVTDVARLAELPRAIRTRVLRAWGITSGATEMTATHVAALEALVVDWHGQGHVDLPGAIAVHRVSGRLIAQASYPAGADATDE